MQLLGIQILAVLFALFMLYVNFINHKKARVPFESFFLWTTLWIGFIIITLFPQLLEPFIAPLNIVRVLDLLMLVAFAILTVFTFVNYTKGREIEQKIERLVRDESMRRLRKRGKK